MVRTVHRLERIVALLRLRREHVLAVLLPVPRLLPQRLVEDLRAGHDAVQVGPELQRGPQRRHDRAPVNASDQDWQILAPERVQADPQQQAKYEPAYGFDCSEVGVRPGHAAKRVEHQADWQPQQGVPTRRFCAAGHAPAPQQGCQQHAKGHDHGFQRVLE